MAEKCKPGKEQNKGEQKGQSVLIQIGMDKKRSRPKLKKAEVESIIDKYLETFKSDNEDIRSFTHSDLLASFHI